MKKYTVFFEQINRTNFQVKANSKESAEAKAEKLYKKNFYTPCCEAQDGWLVESDGEDK